MNRIREMPRRSLVPINVFSDSSSRQKEINIKNDSFIKDLITKVKMDPIWTIKYCTGGLKKRNAYTNGIGIIRNEGRE